MAILSRLSDFQLENRIALKAWADEFATEIEGNIDDLATQLALIQAAQAAADAAAADAAAAAADAAVAQAEIDAMSTDSILDGAEKQVLIQIVQSIINEKAGLNAQATALSITTENTAYNNEYTTLINYLNGLSPAYTDTTQNTTINRTTFNTRFTDFYTDRQNLLNKIDSVASAQSVVIDPINDVIIYADSTGTVKTGELTRVVAITASKGNTSVTTSGTWSRTATTGVTCTMGASTGQLSITALTINEAWVPISFTYSGVTRTANVHIVRVDDPPTSPGGGSGGGGGGSSASTTTLGNTTGTSYDTTNAVSATLTVTAGSAGKVTCAAPLAPKRVTSTSEGNTGSAGKWQWRAIAGAWADITTETADTADARTTYDAETDTYRNWSGNLSVTHTKTGLTPGTDYEFRFLWRDVNVSGTASRLYRSSGTLTADGTVT